MLTDFDRHNPQASGEGAASAAAAMLTRYTSGELTEAERLQALLPDGAESCELLVACPPGDYSASVLAKAVEDCDARLLALTVTAMRDSTGKPVVMLRADTRNPEGIERSLARYGYEVLNTRGKLTAAEQAEAIARVNELLHYLEM